MIVASTLSGSLALIVINEAKRLENITSISFNKHSLHSSNLIKYSISLLILQKNAVTGFFFFFQKNEFKSTVFIPEPSGM